MLNISIADDNMNYVKSLVNFVIGKNSNIKISNIASNGLEVLNIIQKNPDIDLILLDLRMPKLNCIETLNRLSDMQLSKYPDIIVISGENHLLNKIINNPLVTDFVNKSDDILSIYSKINKVECSLKFESIKEVLTKRILSELVSIGYNPSHLGTLYIKDCILEIYESKDFSLINKLESYLYKRVACIYKKSTQNVKSNIMKATNFMYVESDMSFIRDYFHFNDNSRKPTPKIVISTILNKL